MTVANLALNKILEQAFVSEGHFEVTYEYTVRKKLLLDKTYVNEDLLVLVFDDGTEESVEVYDCNTYYHDDMVTIEGEVKGAEEDRYYTITPIGAV